MTDFETIAEKLLVFCDYKHVDEVDADIKKLLELYENLQKENEELRRKLDLAVEIVEKYGNDKNWRSGFCLIEREIAFNALKKIVGER